MSAGETARDTAARVFAERVVGFLFDRLEAHLEERKRHASGEARREFFARMNAAIDPPEK